MVFKDKIALGISIVALTLSISNTIIGENRASFEKKRNIRSELSNVLSRIMDLSKENTELIRDYMLDDNNQVFFRNQSSNIVQENTFLIQQAMYLSNIILNDVTPVELNTIANANANSGDLPMAEKYFVLAIKQSKDPYYSTLAIRSYGAFLFPQRRFEEAREQFRLSLKQLPGGDNFTRGTNGYTYQIWAVNELTVANNFNRAIELFKESRNEFLGIDQLQWKDNMLRGLDTSIRMSTNNQLNISLLDK